MGLNWLSERVSIATPELWRFRDSEMSCINGRGFNFDVAPSLVGIWCQLISRVGDVGDVGGAWGRSKAQRLDSKVRSKVKGFGSRVGVSNSDWPRFGLVHVRGSWART